MGPPDLFSEIDIVYKYFVQDPVRVSRITVNYRLAAVLAGAVFFFGLLGFSPPLAAQELSVVSQYLQSTGSAKPSLMTWTIRIQKTDGAGTEYAFFPKGQAQPVCRVTIGGDDPRRITWQPSDERLSPRENEDILIVSGFPAPCDILPIGQKADQQDYEEQFTAGSATFLRKYRVIKTEIKAADVYSLTSGLSSMALPDKLINFSVVDASGQPVCRQIWIPGDTWWIFEETPFQRAWRQ